MCKGPVYSYRVGSYDRTANCIIHYSYNRIKNLLIGALLSSNIFKVRSLRVCSLSAAIDRLQFCLRLHGESNVGAALCNI